MKDKKTIEIESLKVYANIEKLDTPTFEIDEDGNVKITVAKFSLGGTK